MSSEAPEKTVNENEPEARKSSTRARSSHSRSRRRRSRSRSRSRRRRRSRSRSRSRRDRDRDRDRKRDREHHHGKDRDRRTHRRRSQSREGRSRSRERPKRSKTPPRNSVVPQPNLALIQQLLAQQQANANPQLTRQARRLYVGNLPIGIGLTEPVLMQFFTNAAISVGITTPVPVSSIWVSSEGTFCFVEFRAVSDCTRCLTLFDGLQIGGRPLRIGRPADYAPAPPHLEKYVLQTPGLPPAPAHCTGVQPASVGVATSIGTASAVASVSEPVPAVTPTEVMMLVNMTTREELLDDEEFADIELDIQEECENFGKVLKVVIPRPNKDDSSKDPEGLGRIWVRFDNADACNKARQILGGRMFNNRKVAATFYSLEKFEAGLYE